MYLLLYSQPRREATPCISPQAERAVCFEVPRWGLDTLARLRAAVAQAQCGEWHELKKTCAQPDPTPLILPSCLGICRGEGLGRERT